MVSGEDFPWNQSIEFKNPLVIKWCLCTGLMFTSVMYIYMYIYIYIEIDIYIYRDRYIYMIIYVYVYHMHQNMMYMLIWPSSQTPLVECRWKDHGTQIRTHRNTCLCKYCACVHMYIYIILYYIMLYYIILIIIGYHYTIMCSGNSSRSSSSFAF